MARKPRIITIANQKGGVGKTTTAINLATALAAIGERVLIVDLDPQGNASTGLGIDRRDRRVSAYDVITGEATLGEAVMETAVPNLHLMTCGHVSAEARRSDTFEGHTIHSMLADYQGRTDGGSGYMRIWELSPANGELTVRSYSPTLDRWETDANSEFTIEVDLSTPEIAGAAFEPVGVVEHAAGAGAVTLDELSPGGLYEWYAEVSDCHHSVRTAVSRFRVAP